MPMVLDVMREEPSRDRVDGRLAVDEDVRLATAPAFATDARVDAADAAEL